MTLTAPALAVAAHGAASGHVPGSAGLLLLVVLGVAAGAIARRIGSVISFLLLLTGVQITGHVVLSLTADPMMHHHGSAAPMLLTHLVAIPLCALLIAGAAQLYRIITSVVRTLRLLVLGPVPDLVRAGLAPSPSRRPLVGVFAPGGIGVRGPPAI